MLPENYYLSNFDALTAFVEETYREILSVDELSWSSDVRSLPENARRLYVRLLSRTGNTFRLGKLKYPEIVDLMDAANTLAATGFATTDSPADIVSLLNAVTRPELLKLPELHDMKAASRAQLDARLIEIDSEPVIEALAALDSWVQIYHRERFELFVMCYFGNRYQDLTEFVLRDLGHQTFERYAIDKTSRAFRTRAHVDAHWQYFQCQAALDTIDSTCADELIALDRQLPDISAGSLLAADVHLTRRVSRFRNQLARQLERLQEPDAALKLYRHSELPPSRERQVRLLTSTKRTEDALSLAVQLLDNPIDDSESRFAERQVPALKVSLGQKLIKPRAYKPNTTKLTLQESISTSSTIVGNTSGEANGEADVHAGNVSVEWRALQYYQQSGRCYYCENALLRGVLGLFIWDVMYLPIAGAFHHPFQAGPSDLMQREFVTRRSSALDERWKELDDPLRFSARVWQHWEEKQGIANMLVHWQRLSAALLSDALIRIPVGHWRVMFDRLLMDLRHNAKGLPDLVFFPDDEGYEFIEIKGPGDALQQHQRRWLQYFSHHQIPNRVVHIRYAMPGVEG